MVVGDEKNGKIISRDQLDRLEKAEDFCEQKKYEEAILVCSDLIAEDECLYAAYSKRSYAYFAIKKYEEAFDDIEILIKLKPDSPSPYFKRGYRQLEFGKYQNAIEDLTFVIDTKEYYFLNTAYFYRLLAYYKLGRKKQALEDCLQLPQDFSLWAKLPGDKKGKVYTKDSLRELITKMR